MPTVSEPPYLHKSSGVSVRNGTTTRTITWSTFGDAPFTPATGSLLVAIVFGAVTNSTSGSWTEQLQPVSSGELSVFTSTNNSVTAPPSSITITNNGANYDEMICVMEFPAGSAYVSGIGSTPTADTWPTLTGLTGGAGNERVIIGARGRTITSTITTSMSSSPTAPWVEDADIFQAMTTGTETGYLTVVHAINIIATSATPVSTTTVGGSNSTPDREHVVFAINAVATSGTTSVTSKMNTPWVVRSSVTQPISVPWVLRNTITRPLSVPWALRNTITQPISTPWVVRAAVTNPISTPWVVRAAVKNPLSVPWVVRSAVATQLSTPWVVRAAITNPLSTPWVVRQSINQTLDARWGVAGKVTGVLSVPWALRSSVQATLSTPWALRASISRPLSAPWAQRALVAGTLDARWGVAGKVTSVLGAPWVLRGVVASALDARWALRSQIKATLGTPWTLRAKVTSTLRILWVVESGPLTAEVLPSVGAALLTGHLTAYPEAIVTDSPEEIIAYL
jgi:ABC-type thiamin/hydroxymethylpyrimidine transport system permease subunit